jgi:hypothetical protein
MLIKSRSKNQEIVRVQKIQKMIITKNRVLRKNRVQIVGKEEANQEVLNPKSLDLMII